MPAIAPIENFTAVQEELLDTGMEMTTYDLRHTVIGESL